MNLEIMLVTGVLIMTSLATLTIVVLLRALFEKRSELYQRKYKEFRRQQLRVLNEIERSKESAQ